MKVLHEATSGKLDSCQINADGLDSVWVRSLLDQIKRVLKRVRIRPGQQI